MSRVISELILKGTGDFSHLKNELSELEKKMRGMREFGEKGTFFQLAQKYRSEGNEVKAKQIEAYSNEKKIRDTKDLTGLIKEQERAMQGLIRHESNLRGGLDFLKEGTDKWKKQKEEIEKTTISVQAYAQSLNQLKAIQSSIAPGLGGPGGPQVPGGPGGPQIPGGPGGPGGMRGAIGGFIKDLNPLAVFGTIAAGLQGAGKLYRQTETYPERLAQREAEMARMQSEAARLQAQGRGYEMALFAPERAKAMERARTRVGAEKTYDILGLSSAGVAGAGAGLFSGAMAGAKIGGTIGTAFGGFGAIPGAIIGGGLGLAGGLLGGIGTAAMFSDRKRSMLFNQEAYDKEMGAVFAKTYKEQLAAEREKNYEKDLASQFFSKNSGQYLGIQRQFGMSDEELYLGEQSLLRRVAREKGFTPETTMGAMRGISEAGGSAKVSVAGAEIAAQMQRNLDLTNAPRLMGKVSAAYGMDEIRSKDEILRLYTQAVSDGLDASETRQFMEAATSIGYQTGGSLESISNLLSAGIRGSGAEGTRAIEAAQNAAERVRQQTSELGGLRGQRVIAAFQSEEITKLLGGKPMTMQETAMFGGTDPSKWKSEDLESMFYARGEEITPEKVKELRKIMTKRSAESTLTTQKQKESLENYMKSKEAPGVYSPEAKKFYEFEAKGQFGITDTSIYKMGQQEQGAFLYQMGSAMQGLPSDDLQKLMSKTTQKYETDRGRASDKAETSAAMGAAGELKNLEEKAVELIDAFDKIKAAGETAAQKWAEMTHLSNILEEKNKDNSLMDFFRGTPPNKENEITIPTPKVNTNNMGSPSGGN